jgi:hypothetical protein
MDWGFQLGIAAIQVLLVLLLLRWLDRQRMAVIRWL